MSDARPGQMQIGTVLAQARERAGLDLREVESQTKIRIKYLRALEDEAWDDLPSGAYAKGFLRTYGELLGLDGEAIVDEYRRQVEPDPAGRGYPLAEPQRERRPGLPGSDPRRRWPLIAAAVVLVVAAVLAIVLSGDDDPDERERREGGRQAAAQREREQPRPQGSVELALVVRDAIEVCLIGGRGEALIDGQVLAPGTRESYRRARFELGFPSGFSPDGLRLRLDGNARRLPDVEGPAAFKIVAPARLRPTEPRAAEDCP